MDQEITKEQPKERVRHSTTVYLPRKFNREFQLAMKLRAKELHGIEGSLGKTSKYINDLITRDLVKSGLFNNKGEPEIAKLEALEKKLELLQQSESKD